MADAISVPVAPSTLGQGVDAELAVVKARIAVLEADAKTGWADVVAWFKVQWPHFVTWGGTIVIAAKAGLLHFL